MRKVLCGIAIIVISMLILIGCDSMKFNQVTDKNDLLTEQYSIAQMEELKNAAKLRQKTFSKFKREYVVQCVRKTHQGYYVVLLLEDGENGFCFFDEKNVLTHVMVTNGFKTKTEFQNAVVEQTPKSVVLNFDTNTILAPFSAVEMTAHIVQEGVYIVKYSRFLDGEIIEDPIATSIEFIGNESLLTSEDPFISNEIPFVFELDKASK